MRRTSDVGRIRARSPFVETARYVALFALLCAFLVPVLVIVMTAFKDPAEATPSQMWDLPRSFSLDTFREVWPLMEQGFRNSLMMAIPASLIASLLGAANGFVLS
jgi:glucose/mannose transport system permease protein